MLLKKLLPKKPPNIALAIEGIALALGRFNYQNGI